MKRYAGLVLVLQFVLVGAIAQPFKINGLVTDENLNPLNKATVHLLNTSIVGVTNDSGIYRFSGVPKGIYTIQISATGYASTAESIQVSINNQHFDFKLQTIVEELEDVSVTADKNEVLLPKQPSAVTAINARQVQEYRLWNVKDIAGLVPGLYAGNSGDERNVTSIRGITTTSYDPAVATYVDGVNQFSLDTYIPQLNDIERIEVLRGPQGTLYGRNAMGGVINIITKQPTNITGGFVELNFGNYNQQRFSASLRTPIIKDKLFFGASGVISSKDGFYTNEFNNSSFDKQDVISGNYFVKYLPGKSWSATFNLKHQNIENNGPFSMVLGAEDALAKPFKLNQNAISKMIDNSLNSSLSVHHNGKAFDFTSQTAFQNNHRIYDKPIDGDFSPLDIITVINNYGKKWNNVKVVTQEFRLNSPAGKSAKLTWTAGTYLFHQYNPVKQATHYGEDAKLYGADTTNFSVINTTEAKSSGIALFGQVNYAVAGKLILFGGLRYDYEHKALQVKSDYQLGTNAAFPIIADTGATVNFSALSPKIGLQYQFTTSSNLYTSYARGYRTGGLTQIGNDATAEPPLFPYKPEYSNNIEIGSKNNFLNNRLNINAAVFLTYVQNSQVPTLILPAAITVTRNTGSLTSKGAEVELSAKPFKGFQLDYSAGYTDAKYKSLKVSDNGQNVNLDGKKQIFTPDLTSMLAAQYSYTFNEKRQLRFTARAEWFYFGERFFDLANNIRQAPYNLLNTRVGLSSKFAELFFWERNMGNQTYIEYAYDFGAVHLASPRTYGITLRVML